MRQVGTEDIFNEGRRKVHLIDEEIKPGEIE